MMLGVIDPEMLGWVIFFGYCVIGMPVVWWHVRREKIGVSDTPSERDFNRLLWLLAIIWPVLLLAIFAAWVGEKLDGPSKK